MATLPEINITRRFLTEAQAGDLSALTRVKARETDRALATATEERQKVLDELDARVEDEDDDMTEERAVEERAELVADDIEVEAPALDTDRLLGEVPGDIFDRVATPFVDAERIARRVNAAGPDNIEAALDQLLQRATRRVAGEVVDAVTSLLK